METESNFDLEDDNHSCDIFYDKYSPVTGEVVEDWSYLNWQTLRVIDWQRTNSRSTRHPFA